MLESNRKSGIFRLDTNYRICCDENRNIQLTYCIARYKYRRKTVVLNFWRHFEFENLNFLWMKKIIPRNIKIYPTLCILEHTTIIDYNNIGIESLYLIVTIPARNSIKSEFSRFFWGGDGWGEADGQIG